MAEQYGTKPKKFTAAWWEYFWMYYKWHTIITIFAIIAVTSTIHGMLAAKKYDIHLAYAGPVSFSEKQQEEFGEMFSPYFEDTDKNGKKSLSFSVYHTSDPRLNPEYHMAVITKLQTTVADSKTYAFILSREMAEYFSSDEEELCVFEPLETWFEGEIPENGIYSAHGKAYGIEVSSLEFFKDSDVDLSGHYLFIKALPPGKTDANAPKAYKDAKQMLNKIIKNTK